MNRGVTVKTVASEQAPGRGEGRKSLRQAQVELTRELILKATAEHAMRDPLMDFSMQDIASDAGMHLRSVYRHFPTRRALLESFFDWVGSQMDASELIRCVQTLDDLPSFVRDAYARVGALPENLRQAALLVASMPLRPNLRQEAERLRDMFFAALPHLDPGELEPSFAVIRQLLSGRTVIRLASSPDPDGGEALAWAVSTLIHDLRARDAEAAVGKAHGGAAPVARKTTARSGGSDGIRDSSPDRPA